MKAEGGAERKSAGQHQGAAMKKGWQTKTLGEACEMYQPKTISGKDMVEDGPYPVYGANGVIGRYNQFNHEEPQLLITCRGATCGSVNISAPRSWVTGNAMVVRPKNESLEMRYLEYLFRGGIDISKAITGAAQPQITRTNLEPLEISFPESLAEQQRIVGLLDEAFEGLATAKANAEKNLQNARALFESHLKSVFTQRGPGWVDKPFEDCIEDVKYTTKIQRKEFLEDGEFPIVSQEAEFTNGYWDNAADVFKVTRPVVVFGDHTQVLKYIDFDFVLGADGVKLLPPKPFLNPKFFFYALRSAPLKSLGYARHYRLLKELQIGYPETNAQIAIVKKIDALAAETQRLARLYERKLAALEELKKSLLHQAFTGKLQRLLD